MSKHTPGPMTYSPKLSGSENHQGYRIFNAESFAIAEVQPLDQNGVQGEVYARKFVAVDDLLEALHGLMAAESRGRVMPIGKAWDAARAAIAKATGEQS